MTYLKLDVGFPWHPRLAPLSDRAFRVHVTALCHAKAYLTDGFIDQKIARSWGAGGSSRALRELEDSGLWVRVHAGYVIHDWLEYNPSAADLSAKRSEAGRKGGLASGKTRSNDEANDEAKRSTRAPAAAEQINSRAVAVAEHALLPLPPPDLTIAYRAWEESTGTTLTPMLGDRIADAIEQHSSEWVLDAIREAGLANARSWRYVQAILQRWQRDGRNASPSRNGHGPAPPAEPEDRSEEIRERMRRQAEEIRAAKEANRRERAQIHPVAALAEARSQLPGVT